MPTGDLNKQASFGGRSECGLPRGSRALNTALATVLSVGLGVMPCAPAMAFANEADAAASAPVEQGQETSMAVDRAVAEDVAAQDADSDLALEHDAARSAETEASTDGTAEDAASSAGAASAEPAGATAAATAPSSEGSDATAREGETDLCALWSGQQGGTDSILAITAGGTYRLTGDLTVNSALEVNAPGADVVIDLGAFSLTSEAENASYVIKATACASLTIVGDYAPARADEAGGSEDDAHLVMKGSSLTHVIESAADKLTVRNVSVLVKADDAHNELKKLDSAGVSATKGAVAIEQCAITIDHSNQTALNVATVGLEGCPRGIYLAEGVTSARIADTEVNVVGSRSVEPLDEKESATSPDKAYALYSASNGDVVVAGGSFAATSAHGTATALYASQLAVEAGADGSAVSVSADAGVSAVGIRSAKRRGVSLNGPVEFSLPKACLPRYCAALASEHANGFVLGARFRTTSAPVLVGALSAANADGERIAVFDDAVGAGDRQSMAAMLTNGLEDGACSVRLDNAGLFFGLDEEKAPACVVTASGEEVLYASVEEAIAAAKGGQTVKLLQDAGDIAISAGRKGMALALDMNGKSARSLNVSTKADVRVYSSADGGAVNGCPSSLNSAVSYSGSGAFELNGVDVTCVSASSAVAAVSVTGSGSVRLDGVNVRAVSQVSTARGVHQSAGSATVAVQGGSIIATSDAQGVAVYGVTSAAAQGVLTIDGCDVQASGVNSATGGVDVRGELVVSDACIAARTERAASTVWAVRASSDSAKVTVRSCTVRAECDEAASSGAYWCLISGGATPTNNASWTLAGSCSFSSSNGTHLGFSGTPVTLDASFDASSRLGVYSANLEGDIAFVPVDGADISGLASDFSACAASSYEGWSLRATDDGSLRWEGAPVVKNAGTGAQYGTLKAALSEAQPGETLQLLGDCTAKEALSVDVPVTIDMRGHTLEVALQDGSLNRSVSALSLEGEGDSVLKNGALSVVMQARSATTSSVRLRAVSLGDEASCTFEGVDVSVDYASTIGSANTTRVSGIDVGEGSASLKAGSTVSVAVSGAQPALAVGIDVGGGADGGAAWVERDCSVEVDNRADTLQRGNVVFASGSGMVTGLSSTRLMSVELEEGTALYDEIQRKFKEVALLDVESDGEGYLYGTRMYYAAPITLDDSSFVWAFSDPVSAASSLDPANIKATHFYFQTHCDVIPESYGIALDDVGATLVVEGVVSSACSSGSAFSLYADGDGDAAKGSVRATATARLDAHGSTGLYRADRGAFDLRSELGIAGAQRVTYPITGSYTLVRLAHPEASVVGGSAASSVIVAPGAATSSAGGDGSEATATAVPDYFPDSVEVTFTNLRDSAGNLQPDQERVQAYGSTLGEGGAAPAVSDYERGGVTYRFVGWSASVGSSGVRTWNPDRIEAGLRLDTTSHADTGSIALTAKYVPVGEGEHEVVFQVDDFVEACSVADGQTPSFRDAQSGSTSSVPTKYAREAGMTYGFAGWKAGQSDVVYAGTLPHATSDAVYAACFDESPQTVSAEFYTWKNVGGSMAYASTTEKVPYGSSLDDKVAELAKAGDVVYAGTTVYEFLGWSPRRSDSVPLYTDTVPTKTDEVWVGSAVGVSTALFGVYAERDRVIDVTFVVDGEEYAVATDVLASRTVNGAFNSTGASKPADKSESERFRGWALGSSDGTLLMGAVKTLAELTEGEEGVVLYAVFGSGETADELDDVDEGEGAPAGGTSTGGASGGVAGPRGVSAGGKSSGGVASPTKRAATSAAAPGSAVPKDAEPAARVDESVLPALREIAQAADATVPGEGATASNLAASADGAGEEGQGVLGNTVAFFTGIGALACLGVWAAWRAWRNRRLDAEDDFFEPEELGDQGEQVVF